MSIASAASFIRHARSNDGVARRLAALGGGATYEALCAEGRAAGYDFDAAELAAAFRFDWTARYLHFAQRSGKIV
jgi:hypothetical protein